ncbi:hypothetical protein O9G_000473 [Rozella allomycis CSF55]|uniref:Uncharacterized protein n=1 Tax=Rozella allomycis (strain CSF55) TaxID=988480 RepID=A0A075AYB1_ROZAC|nr:hypothetical protein O9G_000473 [Rozella allomycis CSF55]|eukprot:EPZ33697.1 hypothetical protein O9G_000473 [Rozella allomycis CSF55]
MLDDSDDCPFIWKSINEQIDSSAYEHCVQIFGNVLINFIEDLYAEYDSLLLIYNEMQTEKRNTNILNLESSRARQLIISKIRILLESLGDKSILKKHPYAKYATSDKSHSRPSTSASNSGFCLNFLNEEQKLLQWKEALVQESLYLKELVESMRNEIETCSEYTEPTFNQLKDYSQQLENEVRKQEYEKQMNSKLLPPLKDRIKLKKFRKYLLHFIVFDFLIY